MAKKRIPLRIRIKDGNNEETRFYYTSFPISGRPLINVDNPLTIAVSRWFPEIGEKGEKIIREALDLDGVISITLSRYQLTIRRSPAVHWEEIEPEIIRALTFGEHSVEIHPPEESSSE